MEGESGMTLQQAYLVGCDQPPCVNLPLSSRHCFSSFACIQQCHPQNSLGRQGVFSLPRRIRGPAARMQSHCSSDSTASWEHVPARPLAPGCRPPGYQYQSRVDRSWGPWCRQTLCGHRRHSSGQLLPAAACCTGPPYSPGWKVWQKLSRQTLVSRIVEHSARYEGSNGRRGKKKILNAVKIFLTEALNAVIRYSQSSSFESWIYFLMVIYMSFFWFCFVYSKWKQLITQPGYFKSNS